MSADDVQPPGVRWWIILLAVLAGILLLVLLILLMWKVRLAPVVTTVCTETIIADHFHYRRPVTTLLIQLVWSVPQA